MLSLDLLQKANYYVEVAHCNFQLRGEESENDAAFVEAHCRENNIVFHGKRFDVSREKGSTQMQARSLRHEWFEQLRQKRNLDLIVLGSHLDDRFETALINLLRGTGPAGIRNMQGSSGKVIRPLLRFDKAEILHEIQERKIPFREDSSNHKTEYLRNYLRIEIIPRLKELNPSLLKTYERSANIMAQHESLSHDICERFLEEQLVKDESYVALPKNSLKSFSAPLLIMLHWLKPFGFNQEQLSDLLQGIDESESREFQTEGYRLSVDRKMISLFESDSIDQKKDLAEKLPFRSKAFGISLEKGTLPVDLKAEEVDFIDLDKLRFPLTLRNWEYGDRIQPLGMQGTKKLSDIITDKKLSAIQKNNLCVLESGDEIVCVARLVISEQYKVNENTRSVLAIKRDPTAS